MVTYSLTVRGLWMRFREQSRQNRERLSINISVMSAHSAGGYSAAENTAAESKPENSLFNTLQGFEEMGRGATSINVMSNIQSGLPDSLEGVYKRFGEAVELLIFDHRDRLNPSLLLGWVI